jgi:class 3 adenylate cyclase
MNVAAWLQSLDLERYEPLFRDNEIDWEVLPKLTSEDLKEIGVLAIGHRRKLLDAIAALGAAVTASTVPAAAPDAPAPVEAERRQLTVMFCDLVGSTALSTRHDPEDLRELIGEYHGAVSETVGRFDGFVAKYMGDGVLIYFGYPHAHEDDAERAVRAGLAVIEAVGKLPVREDLSVRLGIATGLAVVGDLIGEGAAQERGVVGETPNLAARLQTLAAPNTLIIAEATRRQVGGLFDLADLGPQALAGFAEPQTAWRVVGESGVASRFAAFRSSETQLVGREEELDLLLRRWGQAKSGEGRIVLLSAEPGIGKSRLIEALVERIAAEVPTLLRYFCSPHHQDSALYPVIGQLERAARFARDDLPAAKHEKLATLIGGSASGADDLLLLAELLSLPAEASTLALELPPQRKKEVTFDALLRQLETLARREPVLMVFEDLHWIDPTTRELLDRAILRVEGLPILLIATFRPEFQSPWTGQPHVTVLSLSRLGRRDGAALVRQLLANAIALPPEIVEEIIERTDGVPLFLEEVTKVVVEAAVSRAAGGTVAALPGARLTVPPTLQASLMARLDRLGPAAREVAQIGAAIGRDFSYELLSAASQRSEAETHEALDRLVAAGLVFQRGVPPVAEYQFKHALVQDTAYGTLLRGPRQALHARIAAAIEERSSDIVERAPEILAHHLTEAGEIDRAAIRWLQAGRRAAGRSANIEAAAHLARGIAGLRGLTATPERNRMELVTQLTLGPVLLSDRGFGNVEARGAYRRAAELAERLGDDRARFAASWGLWMTAQAEAGREDRINLQRQHLDEMFQIADRIGDPELSLQAHHSAWSAQLWLGEFVRSEDHIRQGLAVYDLDKHRHHALLYGGHDPGVCGMGHDAVARWSLGYPDRAAQRARECIVLGEALGHAPSLGHSLWFAGVLHNLRRDVEAARDCGERLLTLGREHGLRQYQAVGGVIHGWALIHGRHADQALPELRSAVARYGAGGKTMLSLYRTVLAEAELRAGNADAAAAVLVSAEEIGQRWSQADFLRLRGELQRSEFVRDRSAAEQSYREAIALAREQSAKSWELRAATSLAGLWREMGRRDAARELLAPVYAWFTEGFDTPDLIDAKALLEELT